MSVTSTDQLLELVLTALLVALNRLLLARDSHAVPPVHLLGLYVFFSTTSFFLPTLTNTVLISLSISSYLD